MAQRIHPISPGPGNEQRPYPHGAENIPPTHTGFYPTYQSSVMPQPGFGNPFPGTQPGWLPYFPHGRGYPTNANQAPNANRVPNVNRAPNANRAPNTLNVVQSARGPNSQLPRFGQQYQAPAHQARVLNHYAPGFRPQGDTRTNWHQAAQPAVGTFNGGGFVHQDIGRNAEPVRADGRQSVGNNMSRVLTGMQHLNIGAGGNLAPNAIPSRGGSSYQISGQQETDMRINRSSSDSQRTGQFGTAPVSSRHEAYRNRNRTYHQGQAYNLPIYTNLGHHQGARGNDQVEPHPHRKL